MNPPRARVVAPRARDVAPRAEPTPAIAPDLWLLAVALAAGLGTARLTHAPGAARVVGPITATVLAGHLAASVARRLRVSAPVVTGAGAVAVVLATVWGELWSATAYGFPTLRTWRTLVSKFDKAGTVIRSHPTPVPATPEVVLCIAMGAGLVAVVARAIWARQEARGSGALVALVPTFGLFCYTALLSSQVDRLPGTLAYLACALGFVISADRSTARAPSERRATATGVVSRSGRLSSGLRATLPATLGAALALLVPLAANPALATLKVNALPFAQPGGPLGAAGAGVGVGDSGGGVGAGTGGFPASTGVRAVDLVDDLKAVLVNRTTELMFSAQTPLPTYWQLAVLTRFNGTAWLPDPTTEAAAQSDALQVPSRGVADLPALPEPAPTKTFRAQVTIGNLESTLLPLPPTTVSVGSGTDVVPGFGALQPFEAAPGLSYVAVARVPAPTSNSPASNAPASNSPASVGAGPAGAGAGPATSVAIAPASLAPYLKLPTEPASVVQLAHQIVAGAQGASAEAAALARWFDTGRYRYTLSPPPSSGPNALASFLFTTRAGFCQQFAAAYAVLARIDGLPTRVAVGFTTGATRGHGGYRVTGADAHVWPEVYLGPSVGWTSYEPTPASAGEAAGVGINTGSRTGSQSPGARSTATSTPSPQNLHRPTSANTTVPLRFPAVSRGTTRAVPTHGRSGGETLVLVVAGVALVVAAALWVRRRMGRGGEPLRRPRRRLGLARRRRRRLPAPDPTTEVLAQWREAETVLERARLGRRPAETLQEHAARLVSLADAKWLMPYRPVTTAPSRSPKASAAQAAQPSIETTVDAYGKLAALAARASYASDPCTAEEAADAEVLGAVVRSGLGGPSGRPRVLVPF